VAFADMWAFDHIYFDSVCAVGIPIVLIHDFTAAITRAKMGGAGPPQ